MIRSREKVGLQSLSFCLRYELEVVSSILEGRYFELLLLFLFTKLLPSTTIAPRWSYHTASTSFPIFNFDVLFIFQGHQNLLLAPCMIEASTGTHLVMLLDSLQDLVMQIVVHALAQANDILVCPSTNGVRKIAVTIVLESVIS